MVKDDSIGQFMKDQDSHKRTITELDAGFGRESERSLENTAEMQRQYTEMQNSFNERIEDLQVQVLFLLGRVKKTT